MFVTSVHANFEASAAKIERSKHLKCEVPNEGIYIRTKHSINEIHNVHYCIQYTFAYY